MQATFLHVADCHLGKWQYNLRERFNDFGRAFHHIVDVALAQQVDFVILAGDLFEKRALDALTLNQAMRALDKLHNQGIPCIAIEGNHERPYFSERVGWMEFLAVRDLLILLTPTFEDGAAQLKPYKNRSGSYYDPVPGVRVHGLRYFGAGTATAIESYAQALAQLPAENIEYTIFMAHAGVEGVLSDQGGGLSHRQWSVLRPHVDYLALGHIHKPFTFDDWIYNPGSPESCSVAESDWQDRGYYLVQVDTEPLPPRALINTTGAEPATSEKIGEPGQESVGEGSTDTSQHDLIKHTAILHANPRRTFHRISMKTDLFRSPAQLLEHCRELLQRKARDVGARPLPLLEQPIVELQLTGVLPFDRSALDLNAVEALVQESFHPLLVLVKNFTRSGDTVIDGAEAMNRTELERHVLVDLLNRDVRFQDKSEEWADIALLLKQLALSGASGEAILAEVGTRLYHQLS
ncbi:MAG: DNA repair exonuclease [Caldilineaceae bacterium]